MNQLINRLIAGGLFQKNQTDLFLTLLDHEYEKSLEVGCGKGFFSFVAAKSGRIKSSYGVDVFNDFQIKEISQYAEKVEYKGIDNETVPYKDETFDIVFSMDVIEHIEKDETFIREHIRVCKKNGRVIIGTPNYYRITNLLMYLLGKLKYPRDMGSDTYGKCIHLREYKKNQLLDLIRKNKFLINETSIRIIPCWFGVMALDIGISKLPRFLENYCQFWFIVFDKKL